MDKEAFLKVVNNPKEITDKDLEDLLETSKFHPYCQSLHILIAKKYLDHQLGQAPAKLHKAAIYAPDRSFLKKIIEDDPSIKRIKPHFSEAATVPPEFENTTDTKEVIETNLEVEADLDNDSSGEVEEAQSPVSSLDHDTAAESINDGPPIIEREVNEEPAIAAPAPQVEKEDIHAELEKTLRESRERRDQEKKAAEKEDEEKAEQEVNTPVEPELPSVAAPFADNGQTEEKTSIDDISGSEVSEKAFDPHSPEKIASEDTLDQNQIIENFIKLNPSLSRFNLKFDEDQKHIEDLSIPKLNIGEHLISENLAVILHKQGKTQKAINIYEKLILKFPEKKAYFASCIEKIKNN